MIPPFTFPCFHGDFPLKTYKQVFFTSIDMDKCCLEKLALNFQFCYWPVQELKDCHSDILWTLGQLAFLNSGPLPSMYVTIVAATVLDLHPQSGSIPALSFLLQVFLPAGKAAYYSPSALNVLLYVSLLGKQKTSTSCRHQC